MQQTQSSMHTHYPAHNDTITDPTRVLHFASPADLFVNQEMSEDNEPIDTRPSLYTNDPHNIRKHGDEQRG